MSQQYLEGFRVVSENLDGLLTSVIADLSSGAYDQPKGQSEVCDTSLEILENSSISGFCTNYCDVHIQTQSDTDCLLEGYSKKIRELECQLNETSEKLSEVSAKNQLLLQRSESIAAQSNEKIESLKKLVATHSAEACERRRKQEELTCQLESLKEKVSEIECEKSRKSRPSDTSYKNLIRVSLTTSGPDRPSVVCEPSHDNSFLQTITSELATLRICLSLLREENKELRLKLISGFDTRKHPECGSQLIDVISHCPDQVESLQSCFRTSRPESVSLYIKLLRDYTNLESKLQCQVANKRVISLKSCQNPIDAFNREQLLFLHERLKLRETIKQISSSLQHAFDSSICRSRDQILDCHHPSSLLQESIYTSSRVRPKLNSLKFYLDLQADSVLPSSDTIRLTMTSSSSAL